MEREKALGDILDALRKGYNPNYQDMAVLEAVRGWEYLAGLPHINDVGKEDSEAEGDGEVKEVTEEPVAEVLEDGMWSEEDLEKNLDPLLNTDYVSLLLEHDEHAQSPASESVCRWHSACFTEFGSHWAQVFDLASYIPDSIYPQYEELKDAVISWLEKLGIVKPSPDAAAGQSLQFL